MKRCGVPSPCVYFIFLLFLLFLLSFLFVREILARFDCVDSAENPLAMDSILDAVVVYEIGFRELQKCFAIATLLLEARL
jgi:hypothetical protein